jgi:carboxyl-terminal processing protease
MTKALRFLAAASVTLVAAVSMAQATSPAPTATTFGTKEKQELLGKIGSLITERAFVPGVDFKKWNQFMEANKKDIEAAKDENAFTAEINKALNKFGFSHIMLFSPQATKLRKERKTVGLGVRIEVVEEGVRVIDGGPAMKAGIEPGDVVIEVNGNKPDGPTHFQGAEGTKLNLKVKRNNGEVKQYEVIRKQFSTDTPPTISWPEKDVAVIKVPSFDLGYNAKRIEELMLQAARGKFLVLDLRSNGGGAVMNLAHLSSMFLPAGTPLGTFISRPMARRYVEETGGKETDLVKIAEWTKSKVPVGRAKTARYLGKVAVLVNGGTGSASEMMAAALREYYNTPLIGQKTAGAVLASAIIDSLPYGFSLQIPFTDYVTIKGMRLEGNGLKPDIDAPMPKPRESDQGVQAAINWYRAAASARP